MRVEEKAASESAVAEPRPRPQARTDKTAFFAGAHHRVRRRRVARLCRGKAPARARSEPAASRADADEEGRGDGVAAIDERREAHAPRSAAASSSALVAPFHDGCAEPGRDQREEAEIEAERGDQQRVEHGDVDFRAAGKGDGVALVQRVPPLHARTR